MTLQEIIDATTDPDYPPNYHRITVHITERQEIGANHCFEVKEVDFDPGGILDLIIGERAD